MNINKDKYIKCLSYYDYWPGLKKLEKLNMDQIKTFEEPYRMYLYCYYGFTNILTNKDIYTIDQLNILIDGCLNNLYLFAAYTGNIKLLKYLKLNNFDINYINQHSFNAFLFAVKGSQLKTCYYLESIGINIYKTNRDYDNAFMIAAQFSKIKILKYLYKNIYNEGNGDIIIDRNIDDSYYMWDQNDATNNAYMIAFLKGNIKTLKYLESIGFSMYYNGIHFYNSYQRVICCNKLKSIKYFDKNNFIIKNEDIIPYLTQGLITNKRFNTNKNILRYFFNKNGRLYNYKDTKYKLHNFTFNLKSKLLFI